MRVQCTSCGEDCSNAYGTWNGDPYHFGCIPSKPKRPAGYAYEHEDGSTHRKPYGVVWAAGGPHEYFDSPFVKRWWREDDA